MGNAACTPPPSIEGDWAKPLSLRLYIPVCRVSIPQLACGEIESMVELPSVAYIHDCGNDVIVVMMAVVVLEMTVVVIYVVVILKGT